MIIPVEHNYVQCYYKYNYESENLICEKALVNNCAGYFKSEIWVYYVLLV